MHTHTHKIEINWTDRMFSLETENQQNCCYTGGKGQGPTLRCSPHLCPLSLGHTARPTCSQVWPREHMTKPWIRDTWCPSPGALSYAMLIPFSAARKLWTLRPHGDGKASRWKAPVFLNPYGQGLPWNTNAARSHRGKKKNSIAVGQQDQGFHLYSS